MKAKSLCYMLAATAVAGSAGAQQPSGYLDTVWGWEAVYLEVDEVPVSLQRSMSPQNQLTRRQPGVPTRAQVLHQTRSRDEDTTKAPCRGWRFMPATPQKFMPYLDSLFVPGNTCAEPCEIMNQDMVSTSAQWVKNALSQYGMQYDLTASYNFTSVKPSPHHHRGDFSAFNFSMTGTWFLAKDCDNSQGVFLTFEADWGPGTNYTERHSSAQQSLGSLSNPQGSLRGGNGVFLPQLALGYSGFDGKWVAMVGTLDLSNYLDQNAYSPSWAGGLMNQSFAYNPCLPLTWANFGFLTAWQPCNNFYAMYATTSTNTGVNQNPFNDLSSNYWAHVGELGFIFEDAMGMGAGTYRLQGTIVDHEGKTGAGIGINLQQQMGRNSRLGFFTRAGYMGQHASRLTGVKCSATAGFMLQAPFTGAGWGSRSNNENISFGFLWERAAASQRPAKHMDEYGLELSTVVQLTPTFFLQPDVQYIFNPVHATDKDGAVVLQLQGVFKF